MPDLVSTYKQTRGRRYYEYKLMSASPKISVANSFKLTVLFLPEGLEGAWRFNYCSAPALELLPISHSVQALRSQ